MQKYIEPETYKTYFWSKEDTCINGKKIFHFFEKQYPAMNENKYD